MQANPHQTYFAINTKKPKPTSTAKRSNKKLKTKPDAAPDPFEESARDIAFPKQPPATPTTVAVSNSTPTISLSNLAKLFNATTTVASFLQRHNVSLSLDAFRKSIPN